MFPSGPSPNSVRVFPSEPSPNSVRVCYAAWCCAPAFRQVNFLAAMRCQVESVLLVGWVSWVSNVVSWYLGCLGYLKGGILGMLGIRVSNVVSWVSNDLRSAGKFESCPARFLRLLPRPKQSAEGRRRLPKGRRPPKWPKGRRPPKWAQRPKAAECYAQGRRPPKAAQRLQAAEVSHNKRVVNNLKTLVSSSNSRVWHPKKVKK